MCKVIDLSMYWGVKDTNNRYEEYWDLVNKTGCLEDEIVMWKQYNEYYRLENTKDSYRNTRKKIRAKKRQLIKLKKVMLEIENAC